nr:hypothetical protein [Desulfobacterales bacterium]
MIPDVTVFNTAWLIEKDLKEFYKRVAGNTYREAREAFGLLSSCEKTREEFFKEYPEELSDVYSKIPRRGGDAMPPPHSTFVSPRWLPFLPSGFKKRFTPPGEELLGSLYGLLSFFSLFMDGE